MNEWVLRLIAVVIGSASPAIRDTIKEWVLDLDAKAKDTPNPMDDVLVGLIKVVLNVKE